MEKEHSETLITSISEEVFESEEYPTATFQSIQDEETLDLLDNMGYLEVDDEDGKDRVPSEMEVKLACKQFRIEFDQSILADLYDYVSDEYERLIKVGELRALEDEFDEEELEVLAELTDVEGEFKLSNFSEQQIKQDPILCRILNFRLSILRLVNEEYQIVPEFTDLTLRSLEELGGYLAVEGTQNQINSTDDFNLLIEKAVDRDQEQDGFKNLAFFKFDSNIRKRDFKSDTDDFERYLRGSIPDDDITFYLDFRNRKKKMDNKLRDHVKGLVDSDTNMFMLRLVQLKLWLIGSYDGDLDANMGDVTAQAFLDLYQLAHKLEELDEDGVDNEQEFLNPERFLLELGEDDLWAINYRYLLRKGFEAFKEEFGDQQTISQYLDDLINASKDPNEKKQIENAVVEVFKDNQNAPLMEKLSRKERRRRRRKLRKGKGFFRNIGQFFKRVGKWIGKKISKVINAIKSFFKILKNGIIRLFREIKEAVGRIIRGIKFLFSKRIIKTPRRSPIITSDFDFDFDVVNDLSESGDDQTLNNDHIQNLQRSQEDFKAGLKFMEVAIPLIIQLGSGPIGWIKAGFQLVKMIAGKKKQKVLSFI